MTTDMECAAVRAGLSPYIDGELDAVEREAFDRHVALCGHCRSALDEARALSRDMRAEILREPAPAAFAERLRGALRRAEPPVATRPWYRRASAIAAALAVVFVLGAIAGRYALQPTGEMASQQAAARDALAAHTRSLLGDRTIDVASSDRHTVKPWFEGRVQLAPPVFDLAEDGYRLVGGRVDVVGGQRVAALVYRHRLHVVTLFVGPPIAASDGEFHEQGYRLIAWGQAGMGFWAVSDTDAGDLRRFAALYRARIAAN